MRKINFNDKFGLTDAVLNGTKIMTRRVIPQKVVDECVVSGEAMLHAPFHVGEIVAIAQSYSDVLEEMVSKKGGFGKEESDFQDEWYGTPGYNNKMFVRADLMQHHIRITNIKIERLQEISEEDCLREGVLERHIKPFNTAETMFQVPHTTFYKNAPREAFAVLIDKVGKKGDWDKNPWVYVYEFELVD
jgi:hypothetical protein